MRRRFASSGPAGIPAATSIPWMPRASIAIAAEAVPRVDHPHVGKPPEAARALSTVPDSRPEMWTERIRSKPPSSS